MFIVAAKVLRGSCACYRVFTVFKWLKHSKTWVLCALLSIGHKQRFVLKQLLIVAGKAENGTE
jgi:hypothetical protein